jgi:hypothetical protein
MVQAVSVPWDNLVTVNLAVAEVVVPLVVKTSTDLPADSKAVLAVHLVAVVAVVKESITVVQTAQRPEPVVVVL